MCWTLNKGKHVVAERKLSENLHIDRLANIVDKYNNTYQRTMKMKTIDVQSSTYFYSDVESNEQTDSLQIVRKCLCDYKS